MQTQNLASARAAALQAKFNAHAPQTPELAEVELFSQGFLTVAPEMPGTIETLRGWLSAMVNNTVTHHDLPAIDDAIARSGLLLRRAQGEDTTAAVAAYEASLLETPDDDDVADNDFGRYGACDNYPSRY